MTYWKTFGLVLSLLLGVAQAQVLQNEELAHVRDGNRAFKEGRYPASELSYKKALEANANSAKGAFNLGDALFQQERYQEAAEQFELSAQMQQDPTAKAQAYHNLGNARLQQAQNPAPQQPGQAPQPQQGQANPLQQSVEAYKQALRYNPNDEDTRYNLAYAQKLLQQQQQQQQNQQQNQDQQNQDQQNQDQQQQDQQNQDQQNQDQQQQQNQDQQQSQEQEAQDQQGQPKNPQPMQQRNMSREELERLLEALKYQEEKLQQEIQKKKVKTKSSKTEKDW